MKVKDILEIIEQNKDFKTRIKIYKSRPETQNIGEVLEHNYKQWLESEVEMCEIDVTTYFKIHRDEYSRIFAIETVGDERELIKEIRKQNEQLHRYKQVVKEIKYIINVEVKQNPNCWDDYVKIAYEAFEKIIQKCEEVDD